MDERWTPDVQEVASNLRTLLSAKCDEALVRAAEATDIGWSTELDEHLRSFGLYELPRDPELLAAVASEMGRSLAPVPWVEVAAVAHALEVSDAAYGLDTDPPHGPGWAVVSAGDGAGLAANEGALCRSGGGDVLVRIDRTNVKPQWDRPQVEALRAVMRLLAAARLVGAARRLVEIGVGYAKEREAFGKPIGSYQAVSHKLADAAVAVEGAELLVKKTAFMAARHGSGVAPPGIFAAMVWTNSVETGRQVARTVHQCMGGFGATLEFPTQLYSRRIRSWALRCGRPGDAYREIAECLLDAQEREQVVGLWHEERGITLPRWSRDLDLLPAKKKGE